MATLADILNDKQRPDDQKIVIEGAETTLGELRKTALFQADYTKKTMALADERRKLDSDRSEFEYARLEAEAKLTELAKQIVQQNPQATRDEVEDMMERDPLARRLMEKMEGVTANLKELQQKTAQQEELLKRQQMAYYEDQHRRVLAKLKQDDPDLDVDELVAFAKENYTPRLDVAYKALTYEKKLEQAAQKAKEEGVKEGLKRAKDELVQPIIPSRRVLSPVAGTPKSFDEAVDAALQDPEILTILGESGL